LFAIEDPEDRVAKLVELNVKEQVLNVMKSGCSACGSFSQPLFCVRPVALSPSLLDSLSLLSVCCLRRPTPLLSPVACVQRRRRETAAVQAFALPRVHGLVYQPGTGQLTRLEIDVDGVMREHGHIFDVA
jgi:hypothetical protein